MQKHEEDMQATSAKAKPAGLAGLWYGLQRFVRYWYLRLIRINATPHNIALGLSSGVFIGLLPVLPFQTVLAVALAFKLKSSKIAAALGTWVSNPLNWVPLYMLFYYVGRVVVPFDVPPFDACQIELRQMLALGGQYFIVLMVGGLVIATPLAALAYFVSKPLIATCQKRRAERIARKRARELNK